MTDVSSSDAAAADGRQSEEAMPATRDAAEDIASLDDSSDLGLRGVDEDDDRRPGDAVAEDLLQARFREASDGSSDAGKGKPDVDVLAKGVASVLGPVMNSFDGGIKGVLQSQDVLSSSIDRLTRELDKLLEDVPHPYTTDHATRLSGIRKRVIAMNTTLRMVQKRIETIQRLLAGHASRAATSSKKKGSMKGVLPSQLPSHGTKEDDGKNDCVPLQNHQASIDKKSDIKSLADNEDIEKLDSNQR